MRGATTAAVFSSSATMHFNPRSSCEERRPLHDDRGQLQHISIHAPHARSDATSGNALVLTKFQSTLLMRGATIQYIYEGDRGHVISIHAPHARSDGIHNVRQRVQRISIHAPHARSDLIIKLRRLFPELFQSTLLMRGATRRFSCMRSCTA